MSIEHRLEDMLSAWRLHIAPTLLKGLEVQTQPSLGEIRINPVAGSEWTRDPRNALRELVVPECLAWLASQGCWLNPGANLPQVQDEIQSAVSQLPMPPEESELVLEIPAHVWALPAAVGAVLGALGLSLLTWLLLENRQIGFLVGAGVGGYALVRVLALISTRPQLRAILQTAVATAGTGMLAGGIWRAVQGRSTGWIRGALYLAGAWLLLTIVRPRRAIPSAAESAARLRTHLDRQLSTGADLVLAFCWSHPDRLPPVAASRPTITEQFARPVCATLSDLHTELLAGGSPEDLRETLRELFQRLQEDGYEWKSVPAGTVYEEAMKDEFDVFGLIHSGQAVRTRRAAVRHRGQVIQKGELRRV